MGRLIRVLMDAATRVTLGPAFEAESDKALRRRGAGSRYLAEAAGLATLKVTLKAAA